MLSFGLDKFILIILDPIVNPSAPITVTVVSGSADVAEMESVDTLFGTVSS